MQGEYLKSKKDFLDFKSKITLVDDFITDEQWLVMIKYDLSINEELFEEIISYIELLNSRDFSVNEYELLMQEIREKCVKKVLDASKEKDVSTKWYKFRWAYVYYGFIETMTEGSVITDKILKMFKSKYGDDYLNVLREVDKFNPSDLTKFSSDVKQLRYSGEEVDLYLLMKKWQDSQHVFHEEYLYPKHKEARLNFENFIKNNYSHLSNVKGKSLILLYMIDNEPLIPIFTISKYIIGGVGRELTTVIGGKNYGLAFLNAFDFNIPQTYCIPVTSLKNQLYVKCIDELDDKNYSVRSSATCEDNEKQSFAGMFNTVLDVDKSDLSIAVKSVLSSLDTDRVKAYIDCFDLQSPDMAVVLQEFKEPSYSGVWIGNDVNSGYLEWVEGNGEKLVSGKVKPTGEHWPSNNDNLFMCDGSYVGEKCLELQKQINAPADLEWCVLDDKLLWLQYRPVTKKIVYNHQFSGKSFDYQGIPASNGVARGKPIYLEDVDDMSKFESGEILLTDFTDPDWVPVMVSSSAIITAEGGFLSHTAIICRELGIPCVTGLGYDTIEELSEEDLIEVDGFTGKVKKVIE